MRDGLFGEASVARSDLDAMGRAGPGRAGPGQARPGRESECNAVAGNRPVGASQI